MQSVAASRHDTIVAGRLPFDAHKTTDVPDGRMKKQHCLHESLQQVDPKIVSPDMGQFVHQQRFHLLRNEPRQQRCGNQNHGSEKSDNNGYRDSVGTGNHRGGSDSKTARQLIHQGQETRVSNPRRFSLQTLAPTNGDDQTKRHTQNTDQVQTGN